MTEHLADPEDETLDQTRIDAVLAAVEAEDRDGIDALLEPLHAADIADLLEQIGGADRRALLRLWSHEIDGEILSEISESIRE
ncbi:MAG TPA: magnesium transporter, partial [Tabrizicola sp.]|nr:magnesium transporter [Tabrizicola sp.]